MIKGPVLTRQRARLLALGKGRVKKLEGLLARDDVRQAFGSLGQDEVRCGVGVTEPLKQHEAMKTPNGRDGPPDGGGGMS